QRRPPSGAKAIFSSSESITIRHSEILRSVSDMKAFLAFCVAVSLALTSFAAESKLKTTERVQAASTVLDEIESAPDQRIPEEVLGSAECVAVVPTMLNGGFIVGARFGRGVASCRTAKGWSAPAFFTIKGGSFGLQIGGQAIDLVMLIMNKQGM